MMKLLMFDTETTDLIKNIARRQEIQPRIIEFFGLSLEQNGKEFKETGTYHSLFNPGIPISDIVTKITGITDERVRNSPRFMTKAEEIINLITSHDVVVAHNLSYDQTVVDIELKRINKSVNWPQGMCTVEQTEWIKGHRLSLTDLHTHLFGEAFENAHAAENDVRAMARCFIKLVQEDML